MSIEFEGKVMVLTGATSGIGFATAVELVRQKAFVIAAGRTAGKCGEAEKRIRSEYPDAKLVFLAADLSSQEEIAGLADSITQIVRSSGRTCVDVLINIAGAFTSWYVSSREGIETQFAVNHLAPFILTHRLMPLLKAAPEARVITVSSGSHYHTKIHWNDIMLRKHYNCLLAYKQSKLCNVLFSLELKRRTRNTDISVFAADPGLVNTEMGLKNTSGLAKRIWSFRKENGASPKEAARSIAWLAAETSIKGSEYIYWKYCRPKKPSPYSMDPGSASRLWRLSEKMSGISSENFGLQPPEQAFRQQG